MATRNFENEDTYEEKVFDNITYIREMLGELLTKAKADKADMLTYLIEMAYIEAGDLQARSGRRSRLIHRK